MAGKPYRPLSAPWWRSRAIAGNGTRKAAQRGEWRRCALQKNVRKKTRIRLNSHKDKTAVFCFTRTENRQQKKRNLPQNQQQKCLQVKVRRWYAEKSPQILAVRGFPDDAGEWALTLVNVLVRRKKQKKPKKHRLSRRRWYRRFGLENRFSTKSP